MKPEFTEEITCLECGGNDTVGLVSGGYVDCGGHANDDVVLWCSCGAVTVNGKKVYDFR